MMARFFGKNKNKDNGKKKTEEKKSAEIDRYLNDLNQQNNKTISLLLLGPGGSGKSTVLKQMEKIYRGSVQNKILKDAAQYIRQNILEDIYDLATQNAILKASHPECQLSEQSQEICTRIASLKGGHLEETELTPDLAKSIMILWKDKGLQETYNIRKRSHIMDNAPYFFSNIDRISNQNYTTNFEDYVRVRHRTTGIIESEFDVNVDGNNNNNKWKFKVTDVGGQRTERKKWLRCFTDIHAIIYVMSLAAYDQTLFEDHTQNCYREALDVFERTMKHEALATIDVIVFLNKNDLFVPKIKEIPFSIFDPNFNPELVHNANAVKEYLRHEYKKRFYNGVKADKSPRRIHFHITCATDTNQIQTVMHLIQFETVRKMMRVGMLM
mmetsp:Transcript_4454/g.3894  ORF Transcript_4454/g.3894 Transcript_4454/m.3894 type:complete len:383 (-) Transcript_4454:91-1239(-)